LSHDLSRWCHIVDLQAVTNFTASDYDEQVISDAADIEILPHQDSIFSPSPLQPLPLVLITDGAHADDEGIISSCSKQNSSDASKTTSRAFRASKRIRSSL